MLGSMEGTKFKPKGVLSLDDTLLTHYGQHFEKIAKLYDHTTDAYVWAHNLVNLHYSDDETDYPISFQLWEPSDVEALEVGLKACGIKLRENMRSKRQPLANGAVILWGSGSAIRKTLPCNRFIKASCCLAKI